MPEKDVGGRDDGSAGDGGGRRCRLLLGDDRPGPRSRLSNPDSKVSLAAMACAGVVVCVCLPLGVVLDTTSEGPHSLFVQIVTVFVQIVTKYT